MVAHQRHQQHQRHNIFIQGHRPEIPSPFSDWVIPNTPSADSRWTRAVSAAKVPSSQPLHMKRRQLLAVVSASVLLLTSGLAADIRQGLIFGATAPSYQFSPTGVQQFFRTLQ